MRRCKGRGTASARADDPACAIRKVLGSHTTHGVMVPFRQCPDGTDDAACHGRSVDQPLCVVARCITVRADVTQLPEIDKVVEQTISQFGRVDILVNAAGIFPLGEFLSNSEEQYEHTMATNVKSQFFMSQRAAQEMKKQNKGKIINFSSVAGKIGFATAVLYCTSKAAILGMTKALALELAPYNIRVNAIVPGNIRTPMNEELLKNKEYSDFMISKTPLKYIDDPAGITQLILFLASDDSDYATGSDFVFDGGAAAGISV